MRAWAWGLRSPAARKIPAGLMSSTNRPRPRRSRGSSLRGMRAPIIRAGGVSRPASSSSSLAEHRVVRRIHERLVALGRKTLAVVLRRVDVFPILVWQLVEHLDTVTVRVRDVHAVCHPVID